VSDWAEHGACKGKDPEIFFPERPPWRHSHLDLQRYKYATVAPKAICSTCPVVDECLNEQLAAVGDVGDDGVWGGTDPFERKAIRAQRRQVTTLTA
jgi:WhiB family transcriptional regulator, redox-sensing transcriptional regulator